MRSTVLLAARRGLLVAAVMVFGSLGFATAAGAVTFTVNSTVDAPQNGAGMTNHNCQSTNGCTLRAAVQASNETGGANTIVLPAGKFLLTIDATGSNTGVDGELEVMGSQITLQGAGSGSTVIDPSGCSSTPCGRAFYVHAGSGLSLTGVALQNGDSTNSGSANNEPVPQVGGAIYSDGTLDLSRGDVVFANNTVTGNAGAVFASGASGSTLSTIYGDTFTGNVEDSFGFGGAVTNFTSGSLVIDYSVFTANNVNSGSGGAVYQLAGALAIDHAYFAHNGANAASGGAVSFNGTSNFSVTNSLFDSNGWFGTTVGGAILQNGSHNDFAVSNTSFDNNQGLDGGAVADTSSAANETFVLDKFANNATTNIGGALDVDPVSTTVTTLTNDVFDHNSTSGSGHGGAVWWNDGSLVSDSSSFTNDSAFHGGALYVNSSHPLSMVNTTMGLNSASDLGGAIYVDTGGTPTTLTNDTIAQNSAPKAGGINNANGLVLTNSNGMGSGVWNTIVGNNKGGDCFNTFPASLDQGFNQDGDGSCFGGLGVPTDKTGVNGNLLAPGNNGGPSAGFPGDTMTVATEAEQAGSPSVDTGTNTACPANDARGSARDKDPCDKGSFELTAGATTTTSTTTSVSTSTSTSTVTKTTGTGGHHGKNCRKGFHKSHGKCVKNKTHKKHKKHHKK